MITTPLLETELFTPYQVHLELKVRVIPQLEDMQDTQPLQEILTYLSVMPQDMVTQLEYITISSVRVLVRIVQPLTKVPT